MEEIPPCPILYIANDLLNSLTSIDIIVKIYQQKRKIVRDLIQKYKGGEAI